MRQVNAEEYAKRLKLYNKGLNDHEIARRLGLTHATVNSWRRRSGLPVIGRRKNYDIRYELYEQGLSDKEIAERLGIPMQIYAAWRRSKGLYRKEQREVTFTQACRAKDALSAEGYRTVRAFLADLIRYSREARKPDVGAFMAEWRELNLKEAVL